jgi:Zn-dependent protease
MGLDFGYIAIVLVVILMSMTLHEAMHAFAGYWLGDNTAKDEGRLTLNPIKHIDPVLTIALPLILAVLGGPIFGGTKPVPFNPNNVRSREWGAALVGLAGPLTNLILSFVFFVLLIVFGGTGGIVTQSLQLAVVVNLGFFIFNMIPIPPLDGSQTLYTLTPDSIRQVMASMEQYGIILIFGIVMIASQQIGTLIQAIMQAILQFYASLFGISVL